MFLAIFYFVFQVVLDIKIPRYASFIFIGILSWTWLQSSLTQAVNSISSNPGLAGQPGFPVSTLPLVATTVSFLNLLLSTPVLFAIVLIEGGHFSMALLALPLPLIINFTLILGVAYMVAAANVSFRDAEHILPVLLQLGYYVTPIFYSVDHVPAGVRWLFDINPVFAMIDAYRAILLHSQFPDPSRLIATAVFAVLLLFVGRSNFARARHRFLEYI
jgi:lipopolysaccharide transport system permease protein